MFDCKCALVQLCFGQLQVEPIAVEASDASSAGTLCCRKCRCKDIDVLNDHANLLSSLLGYGQYLRIHVGHGTVFGVIMTLSDIT